VFVTDYLDPSGVAELAGRIDAWLGSIASASTSIAAIDRGTSDDTASGDPRWYVRMCGDDKEFTTVWLTLGQRTLRYETYVMPAPEDNAAVLFENLLRRNERLVGAHFSIGIEDAVFLRGELLVDQVSEAQLDRVLGTLFAAVEGCFASLIRIGFPRHFS